MLGQQLIDLIVKNKLQESKILLVSTEMSAEHIFPNLKSFEIEGLADIGHSDKVAIFDIKEEEK